MMTVETILTLASLLDACDMDELRAHHTITDLKQILPIIDEMMDEIVADISYYGEFNECSWNPDFTYYIKNQWDEPDDDDIAYVEEGIEEWIKLSHAYGSVEDAIAELTD